MAAVDTTSLSTIIPIKSIFENQEDKQEKIREIGVTAVWSLSSCKTGFGVSQIRDNNLETYWQSDGPQPHLINTQFHKLTAVSFVSIFTDYKRDESYTPSKISIRTGNDPNDLRQVELLELDEPTGWINIEMEESLKTFMIQIAVLGNHQNGRDTHLRQIKLFGPKISTVNYKMPSIEQCNSDLLAQYSCVR